MRRFLIFIIILLISQVGYAGTIHVPGGASNIQAGIDMAAEFDTVLVAADTYTGEGNRDLSFGGKNIVLMSEDGAEATIIDAQGISEDPHRCILFINGETASSKVIGFTLQGGYLVGSDFGLVGNGGGAICLGSSPTFMECTFTQNTSSRHGAAIYCEASSPTVISCKFIDNTAQQNGGAFASEGTLATLEDCIFTGNTAQFSGALHLGTGSNLNITGCLINENSVQYNGGAVGLFGSNPNFENCTISDNGSEGGQIFCDNGSYPVFDNTIISFGQGSRAVYCSSGMPTLYCCDIYGNEQGDYVGCLTGMDALNDNISLDPLFCVGDPLLPYGLLIASPCMPNNNACNELIGAYGACFADVNMPLAVYLGFDPAYGNVVLSATPEIFWAYYDTAATAQSAYEIEVGTDNDWSVAEMWASGEVTSSDTTATYAGTAFEDGNSYYLRIRVSNGSEWGDWMEYSFSVNLDHSIHVPAEYATIQAGVDAAGPGDTVYVAAATYSGEGNRDINFSGKPIVVTSEAGAESTIIDCGGSDIEPHRAFRFASGETSSSVVDGFKMINGFGPWEKDHYKGGAIYCTDASPTVRNCIFEENVGETNGGAISAWGSSMTIEDCIFRNNHAIHGSAIYYNGIQDIKLAETANVLNCLFENNTAVAGGTSYSGAIHMQYAGMTVNVEGCIFSGNSANVGGAVTIWGDATMNVGNCTFVSNRASLGYGGVFLLVEYGGMPKLNISNSILADSEIGEAVFCDGAADISVECSDIYGNAGGDYLGCLTGYDEINNNISADPIFCDIYSGDFLISSGSPCAPDNSGCGLMGAGGIGCEPPHVQNINYGPGAVGNIVSTFTPEIFWSYFDNEPTTQAAYEIQVGTDEDWGIAEMWDPGPVYSADTSVTYAGAALTADVVYYLRIRVNNGTDWGSWNQSWFSVHLPSIIHVPDQFETIQEGVDAALTGDSVYVAPGTYSGEGNRDIHFDGKGVRLVSEDGAQATIIDCGGSEAEPHRAFRFAAGEGPDAIVDGFTMINGFGPYEKDHYKGGAIYCTDASPTVRNCIFEENIGHTNGGAISAWGSSMVIENCTFTSNHAVHGSAIYFNGIPDIKRVETAVITNCMFEYNTGISADVSFSGAVHMQYGGMTLNLNQCVFYANEADVGGAATVWANATMNVSGCTFVGNKSNLGGGGTFMLTGAPTLNIENSIIAFSKLGQAVFVYDTAAITVECTDIYGNAGGNWVGFMTGLDEGFGNIEDNPLFCNAATGDLSLFSSSPCLPENSDCEELIGALGQGCSGYNYQVWKVKADGSGDVPTIQDAIDQGINGDTILMKNGIYGGNGNRDIDLWGKEIVIMSENGPYFTTIDCQGSESDPHRGFRLCNGETPAQIIKGLTIRNGFGAVEKDHPKGGAVYLTNSSPTFEECIFIDNHSLRNGGAISGWGSSPVVNSCLFMDNTGMHGAAVYLNGVPDIVSKERACKPVFKDCSFIGNEGFIQNPGSDESYGGAILVQYGNMQVEFDSCLFYGNSAYYGSAATAWQNATLVMNNCTVIGNHSDQSVSGAVMLIAFNENPGLQLNNSIVAYNTGAEAVHCEGNPTLSMACNDIFANSGGDYSGCIAGFAGTNGNLSLDPLFCDLGEQEFNLQPESPCAPENNSCGELIGAFPAGCATCGDANCDDEVNISDAVCIINYVFIGGAPPDPMSAGDANCDETVNVSDAVYLINYIFISGTAPCDTDGDAVPDC